MGFINFKAEICPMNLVEVNVSVESNASCINLVHLNVSTLEKDSTWETISNQLGKCTYSESNLAFWIIWMHSYALNKKQKKNNIVVFCLECVFIANRSCWKHYSKQL